MPTLSLPSNISETAHQTTANTSKFFRLKLPDGNSAPRIRNSERFNIAATTTAAIMRKAPSTHGFPWVLSTNGAPIEGIFVLKNDEGPSDEPRQQAQKDESAHAYP